jgi:hypothetical protein
MTRDEMLQGWLCILRLNHGAESFQLPSGIRASLEEKGWVEFTNPDIHGDGQMAVMDVGLTESDLCAPEWGIGSIPQEAADGQA